MEQAIQHESARPNKVSSKSRPPESTESMGGIESAGSGQSAHSCVHGDNISPTLTTTQPDTASKPCAHVGYVHDKKKLVTRLRRIEGQVRAITAMVENDTYCIDILTQIAASNSALKSVALLLLGDHLDSCVATAAAKGGPVADEKMDEAIAAITRLVKS